MFVAPSPLGGRGVFAARSFRKGELIERCPYLRLRDGDVTGSLDDYVFDDAPGRVILPLGFGALYNHAPYPNVEYIDDDEAAVLEFVALRDVSVGEELCIDYGPDWWQSRVLAPRLTTAHGNGGSRRAAGAARRRRPDPRKARSTRSGTTPSRRG